MTARFDPEILLGVSPNATPEEIKRAFRRRARALHPDMHSGQPEEVQAEAAELFRLLNSAYRSLTEPGSTGQQGRTSAHTGPKAQDSFLMVRPRSHRAGPLSPGTAVSLTLTLTAPGLFRPAGEPRFHAVDYGVEATVTRASLTETGIEVSLRIDTSKLGAHRDYDIPFHVTWGSRVGTVHVRITTGELTAWNPPRETEEPEPPRTGSRWPFDRMARWRQVIYSLYAGIALPIVGLAWSFGQIWTPPGQPWLPGTGAVLLMILAGYILIKTKGLSSPHSLGPWGTLGAILLVVAGFLTLWASLIAGAIALVIVIVMALLGVLAVVLVIAVIVAALNG